MVSKKKTAGDDFGFGQIALPPIHVATSVFPALTVPASHVPPSLEWLSLRAEIIAPLELASAARSGPKAMLISLLLSLLLLAAVLGLATSFVLPPVLGRPQGAVELKLQLMAPPPTVTEPEQTPLSQAGDQVWPSQDAEASTNDNSTKTETENRETKAIDIRAVVRATLEEFPSPSIGNGRSNVFDPRLRERIESSGHIHSATEEEGAFSLYEGVGEQRVRVGDRCFSVRDEVGFGETWYREACGPKPSLQLSLPPSLQSRE